MNKFKYLYIDDEVDCNTFISGFCDTEYIDLELLDMEINMSIDNVVEKIKSKWDDYSGIIFDMRLNGGGPNRLSCSASTIAQNLRSMCVEDHLPSKPFVLCSTDAELRKAISNDTTSRDLYDYVFSKDMHCDTEIIAKNLYCLAEAYKVLTEKPFEPNVILGRDTGDLDDSVVEYLERYIANSNAIVQFIINDLFRYPGLLINEDVLAARLGIDRKQSGEAFNELSNLLFDRFGYKGVLSNYRRFFWNIDVIKWFEEISNNLCLRLTEAGRRVEIVQRATNIKGIVAANPIEHDTSTYFWTICEAKKEPIDPLEAYTIMEDCPLKPWQEPRYISFLALSEHTYDEIYMLSASEKKRYDARVDAINDTNNG